jgi:hypothetical protein
VWSIFGAAGHPSAARFCRLHTAHVVESAINEIDAQFGRLDFVVH